MSPGSAIVVYQNPAGPSAALANTKAAPSSLLVMMLAGFQVANPDKLKLSDYLTPLGIEIIETAWNIQPVHHLNDTIARFFKLKGAIMKAKATNLDAWTAVITDGSSGTRKPFAPILMCMDTCDGGTIMPVPLQQAYANRVKKLGGSIEIKEYSNDDHFSLPSSSAPAARAWLNGLF
jgi:hypothetical protein